MKEFRKSCSTLVNGILADDGALQPIGLWLEIGRLSRDDCRTHLKFLGGRLNHLVKGRFLPYIYRLSTEFNAIVARTYRCRKAPRLY